MTMSSDDRPPWPAGLTEADIDHEGVRHRWREVFEQTAPDLLPEWEARELEYTVDSPTWSGYLTFTVYRVATGELLATASWHWTDTVRPGWSPPPGPAPDDEAPPGTSRRW